MLSRPVLRLLSSLPKPVFIGALLTGLVVFANAQVPRLQPLLEPTLTALTGLTGFLVALASRLADWKPGVIGGMIGALLVAGFYLSLTIWLQTPLEHPLGLALLRAMVIGIIGACLARLLRQRAVL
ncbi:MAG TPA: hypothetical protein VG817_01800 [Gemmatimonadales bacterium]|nr:hypothetical protein [Gemmatimonadales bacterium]